MARPSRNLVVAAALAALLGFGFLTLDTADEAEARMEAMREAEAGRHALRQVRADQIAVTLMRGEFCGLEPMPAALARSLQANADGSVEVFGAMVDDALLRAAIDLRPDHQADPGAFCAFAERELRASELIP